MENNGTLADDPRVRMLVLADFARLVGLSDDMSPLSDDEQAAEWANWREQFTRALEGYIASLEGDASEE